MENRLQKVPNIGKQRSRRLDQGRRILKNGDQPDQDLHEELRLDWLEQIDQAGPMMDLRQLEELLNAAPDVVKETRDYEYFRGLFDGRMIHEELGGL